MLVDLRFGRFGLVPGVGEERRRLLDGGHRERAFETGLAALVEGLPATLAALPAGAE